jgi:PPOX class probable F420-dependent enzyme
MTTTTAGLDSGPGMTEERRAHVHRRLTTNQIAWLTTVDREGGPHTVPVWFLLREDGTILVYTRRGKAKIASLGANPRVALSLDGSDIGRDVVRVEGTARVAREEPPADQVPAYRAKYAERIDALFGDPADFARLFSVPLVITPERVLG